MEESTSSSPSSYSHHHQQQQTDLDFSFTSSTTSTTTVTDRSFTTASSTSSARSSLSFARSSGLNLSFNESRLSNSTTTTTTTNHPILHPRPHRKSDPNWTAMKAATNLSSDGILHLSHLKLIRHVGTGNLGRVFLCQLRDYDGADFALKVVDNDLLTAKKLSHVQMEAKILSGLDHPFLPTLYAHIEVSHYTCLLMDYAPRGDLHNQLRKQPMHRFSIETVRFFAAEVLVALEYLHAIGVVYRDLKPENILLREDGHIMLSDFDLCFTADVSPKLENRVRLGSTRKNESQTCGFRLNRSKNRFRPDEVVSEFVAEPSSAFSKSCVGTHEYLAPELISGHGHGNGVDWWAFGIFVFELIYGSTPFKGGNKEGTLRNIASARGVKFPVLDKEEKGLDEAKDLIEKLLVKDQRMRLGSIRGATDIKRHPFFDGIKWPLIRTYRPPDHVRGLMRKNKTHHVTTVKKRRSLWKRLEEYFVKNKGSKRNLKSNSYNNNYYCYVSKK